MRLFLLYESAAGLALFKRKKYKEGTSVENILELSADKSKFKKKFKLVSFFRFPDSTVALTNL